MNRSGHVFSLKYTPKVSPPYAVVPHKEKVVPTPPLQVRAFVSTTPVVTTVPIMTKSAPSKEAEDETSKGKEIVNENEQIEGHKNNITAEEGHEFLKLIKKSDFKIVDQLGHTPSKISILSLLLSYEAH